MTTISPPTKPSTDNLPEPTWEIAYLFPPQGMWGEGEYLALTTNRLVEFSDGYIEVLPVPTELHQLILAHLYRALADFVRAHALGLVLMAGIRVRLWPGKYREPDIVFMRAEHAQRRHNEFWEGADLVMEVVSDSDEDRRRDLEVKRVEYARAGIPEYWLVDPAQSRVTVLQLEGDHYATHGEFGPAMQARSALLEGFAIHVAAALRGES
jgi:Uma2 family endonuclease